MTPFNEPVAESFDKLGLVKQDITLSYQKESDFYKRKDGTIFPYYKKDIKKQINVFKPSTFLPIFQELDIPFYENEWLKLIERCIEKGQDFSSIFGKYLAKMKLYDFKIRNFSDSDKFFSDIYDYRNFRYIPNIRFEINYDSEVK